MVQLANDAKVPPCNRHRWLAVEGTQKPWPVYGPNGQRVKRYDIVHTVKCTVCDCTDIKTMKMQKAS